MRSPRSRRLAIRGNAARALGSLAPHLSAEQITDALAAARAIGDKGPRARALGSLAPHLPGERLADALAAGKAIGDEWSRARTLGSLAPYLSGERLADALATAKAIAKRARSNEIESPLHRHARACRGHSRLSRRDFASKKWMAGTSPAMTPEKSLNMTGTRSNP